MNKQDWNKKAYLRTIPAIVIGGIIVFFSSLPNPPRPPPSGGLPLDLDVNTILHICEYAGFAFFVAFGFLDRVKIQYLLIFTLLFAFLDEVHQYFVPSRYYDTYDILVNSIGVIIGFLSYIILLKLKQRLFRKKDNLLNEIK